MNGGKYWKPRAEAKADAKLGPNMRRDGTTLSMDFSYRSKLKGNYEQHFEETWQAFKLQVPRGWWWLAQEHPYGGVEIRDRAAVGMSMSSMEFCYFLWRLDPWLFRGPNQRVLDIGAGYGGLARVLKDFEPGMDLTLVDLEPMLRIQQHYLKKALARLMIVKFVPSIPPLLDHYHLAINTRSFCEMDLEEVNAYLDRLDEVLVIGGIFYSVNHQRCQNNFLDWKVPLHWSLLDERVYPLPEKPSAQWMERTWRKDDAS